MSIHVRKGMWGQKRNIDRIFYPYIPRSIQRYSGTLSHRPGYVSLILRVSRFRELDTRPIERCWEGTSLSCSIRIKVGCFGRSGERISSHCNCECDYQRADKLVSSSIGVDLLKFPYYDSVAFVILLCLPWPHAGAITRMWVPCFGIVYHHSSIGVERGGV